MTDILKLFQFIKEKEGYEIPFKQKLIYGYPFTEEELKVGGDIDLSEYDRNRFNSKVTFLPDGLSVDGYLSLFNCVNFKLLPDGLVVGSDLNLWNCASLTSLPKGLTVGGDLYLVNTPIANEYTEKEIRKICNIKGKIYFKI